MADGKKEKENIEVSCLACDTLLQKDHIGVQCTQGHHICVVEGCAERFVSTALADPTGPTPPNCPTCKAEIISHSFERQLDDNQKALYLSYVAMKSVDEGMKLMSCPSCSYFEMWPDKQSGMDMFYCRNDSCGKISCSHCKIEISAADQGGFSDEDFDNGMSDSTNFMYHMECAELAGPKQLIDEAIEKGLGMTCPNCGHFGRKDEACTHIRCVKCISMYCYVCGLKEENCNKANPSGNIYSHNEDWDLNPRRCPMYLSEIEQIDDRWPDVDAECVAFASRLRTIGNLRQAYETLGSRLFNALRDKYDSIKNCGFTLEETLEEDLTFIVRRVRLDT